MSATLLEQARASHEEIERLERLIVKDLQQDVKGHKEKMHQNHRVKNFLDSIVADSGRLVSPDANWLVILFVLYIRDAQRGSVRSRSRALYSTKIESAGIFSS